MFALLCTLGGLWVTGLQAAEAPDDGLLEFLGSVDTEDKDWHDYLSRTDIDRIARRAGKASEPAGAAVPVHPGASAPAQPAPPAGDVPAPVPPSVPAAAGKPVASQ